MYEELSDFPRLNLHMHLPWIAVESYQPEWFKLNKRNNDTLLAKSATAKKRYLIISKFLVKEKFLYKARTS